MGLGGVGWGGGGGNQQVCSWPMFALNGFYLNENRVKCCASDLFYLYMKHQHSEICCLNTIKTEEPISPGLETL